MANKNAAFGLKPSRMMGGAPYSGGQSRYRIANNQCCRTSCRLIDCPSDWGVQWSSIH